MKYNEVVTLIENAGFTHKGFEKGIGLAEGRNVAHYNKVGYGASQSIQLAINEDNEEDILPIFSTNVPEILRDAVYKIMNAPSDEIKHSYQMG